MNRRNAAERSIIKFKNHFVAGICSTYVESPMHFWCRLITQATLTLNILRTYRLNSQQSVEEQLNGTFNFNKVTLAPPGKKIIAHEKPSQRTTWAPHRVNGCYLGLEPLHYISHTIYTTEEGGERILDTVHFLLSRIEIPTTNSVDQISQAAKYLTTALKENPKPNTLDLEFGDATILRQP